MQQSINGLESWETWEFLRRENTYSNFHATLNIQWCAPYILNAEISWDLWSVYVILSGNLRRDQNVINHLWVFVLYWEYDGTKTRMYCHDFWNRMQIKRQKSEVPSRRHRERINHIGCRQGRDIRNHKNNNLQWKDEDLETKSVINIICPYYETNLHEDTLMMIVKVIRIPGWKCVIDYIRCVRWWKRQLTSFVLI